MVHLEEYTLIRTLIFSVFISVLQKKYIKQELRLNHNLIFPSHDEKGNRH